LKGSLLDQITNDTPAATSQVATATDNGGAAQPARLNAGDRITFNGLDGLPCHATVVSYIYGTNYRVDAVTAKGEHHTQCISYSKDVRVLPA